MISHIFPDEIQISINPGIDPENKYFIKICSSLLVFLLPGEVWSAALNTKAGDSKHTPPESWVGLS